RGCLNSEGMCKARFPRELHEETTIDDDGHVNMRQHESNLNTINKIVTFFARSNTDCTSLLSGTAVKAVISYVTDYISKLGLKSYQAFASVFDVFEHNAEDLNGVGVDEYSTKKLMRQMVNSMSTKMEIGSPMACMYLLGNPDHYPSHQFANFMWRSYVNFVKKYWIAQMEEPEGMKEDIAEDKIKIQNDRGTLVGSSMIDDYALRPLIFSDLNLYEWIQCHQKKELNNGEREALQEARRNREEYLNDADGADSDDDSFTSFIEKDQEDSDSWSDAESIQSNSTTWSLGDTDDVIVEKQAKHNKEAKAVKHLFIGEHKQRDTHGVWCDFTRLDCIIPNFIGGAIPRSDRGDREYYCMSIMTIFKAWRAPADLKDKDSTWDETFNEHMFTPRQRELLGHFNLRFECNDARDNHYNTMKQK
ncbi:hypothetical protein B0H16DRAFT_1269558, partial [Mycena metata]